MSSSLLIVHDSRLARSIVRRLLLVEAPDFRIDEASDIGEAATMLQENIYDIVVCNEILPDGARLALLDVLRRSGSGAKAGYVFILSETTTREHKQELVQAGINALVQIPFNAEQIAEAVRSVRNPRNRRIYRRVSIPDSRASISFGNSPVVGHIVNLSVNGMLFEYGYEAHMGDPFRVATVDLFFPSEFAPARIGNLRARAIRLQALAHRTDFLPVQVRSAWQFVDLSPEEVSKIVAVVQQADDEDDLPAVESRAFGR